MRAARPRRDAILRSRVDLDMEDRVAAAAARADVSVSRLVMLCIEVALPILERRLESSRWALVVRQPEQDRRRR